MKLLINIIILIIYISIIKSDDNFNNLLPLEKNVVVTIRDLSPQTNPDFEIDNPNKVIKGLVKEDLNEYDRSPLYCCGDDPAPNLSRNRFVIHNQTTFYSWFHNVKGENMEISKTLVFKRNITSEDPRIYQFSSDNFFPIDNMGFESPSYNGPVKKGQYKDRFGFARNFHFCLELHASFFYIGGEVFNFKGDDDVWVFINNELVLDLGAPHDVIGQNGQGSVQLDDLGLKKSKSYNFDFFYCERHSTDSHIMIETSIDFKCKYYDFCGVCEGMGKCCNPNECYGRLPPCGHFECPGLTDIPANVDWRYHCKVVESNCSNHDSFCNKYECNTDTNKCEVKTNYNVCDEKKSSSCVQSMCDDKKGGCYFKNKEIDQAKNDTTCYKTTCNEDTGQWEYQYLCQDDSDKCTNKKCIPHSGCSFTPVDCDDKDHCTIDSCSKDTGCIHEHIENCVPCANESICSQSNDKCKQLECNPYNSSVQCVNRMSKDCDDNNMCTIDTCNGQTGECESKPKQCKPKNKCSTAQCNSKTGECINVDHCDDGILCTIDVCSDNGTCHWLPNSCDDGDACTIDYCLNSLSLNGGCAHKPKTCVSNNPCFVASCDKKKGCIMTPIDCPVEAFCLIGFCDNSTKKCMTADRPCIPDEPRCQYGICSNETKTCIFKNYDPLPFKCQTAAVKAAVGIGAAATAGIVIGGAVALGLAIFGGKKGYDAWKSSHNTQMGASSENPLYVANQSGGENPLYTQS
ncbi:hypothetical protein DICPUDRAFT_78683 [Dictyostelium purpureum]|uniref:PA14 domain-containing protein n=1 Tax=Dictyostelium purpureum TaxID=5786 RepID=F0ZK87_DICPU|nr:uncharacterized protein DICPUDRAFT_78683 [Dictyostelium purpureum]EGC35657.1 hypothetical protein DICPUDRAFT_78683 [Dictyostelium purpureum]|eukprot:XP_003287836.1 hypothetical protein DICPUDRAFT_78683 [Dictyostelium purpureum]